MARRSSLPLLDAYASIRCEVRLQHLLDDEIVLEVQRDTTGAEQRRIDAGRHHEDEVLAALAAQHGESFVLINQSLGRQLAQEATQAALDARVPLIAQAWLPADEEGRRRGGEGVAGAPGGGQGGQQRPRCVEGDEEGCCGFVEAAEGQALGAGQMKCKVSS